jgi:alkyl sulfatase BDS1-like metallo-beta-lactamase superfamily hydrolase
MMSHFPKLPPELAASKDATPRTAEINAALLNELPFEDRRSFENAARGFIASLDPVVFTEPETGRVTYDLSGLEFVDGDPPATVNPSLWRQSRLNAMHHGLFQVVDGIYQVRSFDLANMTAIRGDSGWVLIDPLTSSESSRAALNLINEHLGERPVSAVIITHSHVDHFMGILGVVDPDDVVEGRVDVIAPEHFIREAISENVLAGNVMSRRANYMYGMMLPYSEKGFVGNGLGPAVSRGTFGMVMPTDIIKETGETRVVDGVEIEFQMTPGSEAVSEFVFFLPRFRALFMSEITSHHLHNVYTPRGAQVRDALAWSRQINESIDLFGHRLDIHLASHHWPTWGRDEALDYLKQQRDLYKYIHDQTLRLANHGYTKEEIAEVLILPDSLSRNFSNRGYYGSVSHNAKAVYVKYLGYYNGNPASLNPLPPVAAARRYVEFMGGVDEVVAKARDTFKRGDYRWTAQVLNHVVMSDPGHEAARALLADALEQLGYQAESGPWRNMYLTGAMELRHGKPESRDARAPEGVIRRLPLEYMFQAMAVRLNGPKAAGLRLMLNLEFTDIDECWLLTVENGVLNSFAHRQSPDPTATLRLGSIDFKLMMSGHTTAGDLMTSGALAVEGDIAALAEFGGLFDRFDRFFSISTGRQV